MVTCSSSNERSARTASPSLTSTRIAAPSSLPGQSGINPIVSSQTEGWFISPGVRAFGRTAGITLDLPRVGRPQGPEENEEGSLDRWFPSTRTASGRSTFGVPKQDTGSRRGRLPGHQPDRPILSHALRWRRWSRARPPPPGGDPDRWTVQRRCGQAGAWARAVVRRNTGLLDAIAALARKHRLGRLAFQPEAMSVEMFQRLRKALRPTKLVALPQMVRQLRIRKDSTEIEAIQRAVEIAQEAFTSVTRRIRLGMTERELAADLRARHGAARRERRQLPHHRRGRTSCRLSSRGRGRSQNSTRQRGADRLGRDGGSLSKRLDPSCLRS